MGMIETLGRIPKILEANVNAILDKCEDPAKMIDQMLVDYKRNLADVKRDTAAVMAEVELSRKRLEDCDADIARKQKAAENALKAGAEEDARKLIQQKQTLEQTRSSLADTYNLNNANAEQMKAAYNKLVSDIENLEARRDATKAKLSAAKAQNSVNKTVAKAGAMNATEAFSKYEDKANKAFAQAQATAQLDAASTSADELTLKYAGGSGNASVDDEIAAMKASLGIE
jgi:phage shock protein A